MDISIQLQLEAIKLIQEWSIWLITLSTGFIGASGFAFRHLSNPKQIKAAKKCIIFLLITIVIAVFLVGAIPAIIQKIDSKISDHLIFGIFNAKGIYGYLYLDFIPVYTFIVSQRITFLIALFFGSKLIWLRYGKSDQITS